MGGGLFQKWPFGIAKVPVLCCKSAYFDVQERHSRKTKKGGAARWLFLPLYKLIVRLIVDRPADNIKQLVCNGLLPALVVLQVEILEQFVGIVGSRLHGNHSCGVLRGNAV